MPPTNIRGQIEPHRSQFRLRSLLLLVVVIALLLALTLAVSRNGDHSGGCVLCYVVTLSWAAMMRCPGAWLGARFGVVARQALGWCASFVASVGAILVLNIESPNLLSDINGGLGAAALIHGIVAASIVEAILSRLEASGPARESDDPP